MLRICLTDWRKMICWYYLRTISSNCWGNHQHTSSETPPGEHDKNLNIEVRVNITNTGRIRIVFHVGNMTVAPSRRCWARTRSICWSYTSKHKNAEIKEICPDCHNIAALTGHSWWWTLVPQNTVYSRWLELGNLQVFSSLLVFMLSDSNCTFA